MAAIISFSSNSICRSCSAAGVVIEVVVLVVAEALAAVLVGVVIARIVCSAGVVKVVF